MSVQLVDTVNQEAVPLEVVRAPFNAVITAFDGTGVADGAMFNFAGRDTVDDGGGGPLRFLAGSTAIANGVTVYAVTGGRLVREGWSVFGVNVLWAGAKRDGVSDDTAAVQSAINVGVRVYFPRGTYLVDPVIIPAAAAGAIYSGDGWTNLSTKPGGTVLKAKTTDQAHIVAMASGADGVVFEDIAFDGDAKSLKCIDGTNGAFFNLRNVGVYGSKNFGFYGKQGLARIERVYSSNHAEVGFQVYSDSWISDSEFNKGTEPLRVVAGGCRLTGVLANSGAVSCVTLEPFDSATNHINTSITNCYFGEVRGGASEVPILKIKGNSSAGVYVQQVQLSNSHFVSAALSGNDAQNKNNCIDIDYARSISIDGCTALGVPIANQTVNRYMGSFVVAGRCIALTVSNNTAENCGKSPVKFKDTVDGFSIADNVFYAYSQSTAVATGNDVAAVQILPGVVAYGVVSGNTFNIPSGDRGQTGMIGGNTANIIYADNLHRFADTVGWSPSAGVVTGDWMQVGSGRRRFGNMGVFNQSWSGPSFSLGAYNLWVDSTGKLRIKNGAPTSDTDGTVVGTQT